MQYMQYIQYTVISLKLHPQSPPNSGLGCAAAAWQPDFLLMTGDDHITDVHVLDLDTDLPLQ